MSRSPERFPLISVQARPGVRRATLRGERELLGYPGVVVDGETGVVLVPGATYQVVPVRPVHAAPVLLLLAHPPEQVTSIVYMPTSATRGTGPQLDNHQ